MVEVGMSKLVRKKRWNEKVEKSEMIGMECPKHWNESKENVK